MNKLIYVLAIWLISPFSLALDDNKPIELLLKVKYVDVENGFYGFETLEGRKYVPTNMPESFQQDGLPIRVTAIYQPRTVGIHMWGEYIRILSIQTIDCEENVSGDEIAAALCESYNE